MTEPAASSPSDSDCLLVYEDGRAEVVSGATWSPDDNGWYFDPPLAWKPGMRLVRRDRYQSELRELRELRRS